MPADEPASEARPEEPDSSKFVASDSTRVRVRFQTLGCRLNQSESEEILRTLASCGVEVARTDQDAAPGDVVIVNTCTVTADAARTSRKLVRKAASTGARVVVTGCFAVSDPRECEAIPGVVAVVANKDKDDLAAAVASLPGVGAVQSSDLVMSPCDLAEMGGQVRGAFKVQTGCDERCTYCVIPSTRGPLRSRSAGGVVDGIRAQVRAGVREVALTGVQLGKYGHDCGSVGALAALVRRILDEVPELPWLRLSSIECSSIDDDLLDVLAHPRVCNHIHVPLQSGSDRILAAMARPYDRATWERGVARIRDAVGPDTGITTDVMVGFPGETEADFADSLAVVESARLSRLHVFRYSPRPGTPAARRSDQVDEPTKKERSSGLRQAGRRLAADFHSGLVGKTLEVMIETASGGRAESARCDERELAGTSRNFVKASVRGPMTLVGSVVAVEVAAATAAGISGRVAWGPHAADVS